MQEVLQEASLLQHIADDCIRGVWSFTTGDHVRKYVADNLEWSVKREVRTIRIVDLALSLDEIAHHVEETWTRLTDTEPTQRYDLRLTLGLRSIHQRLRSAASSY